MLKTIYGATVVVLIFSFLMSFFSRQILYILYGGKFLSSQNILILMSAATFLASFGYIIGYYLLAVGKMWLATLLNLVWFVAIIAPAYHLIKYLGVEGLGISYLSSYILLSAIFIFYIKRYLKSNINKIALHMTIGTIFPISLLVMNHIGMQSIFYVILLVLFVILFIMIVPKMIDKTLIVELFKKKIGLAYNENENQ
jgi:O-antigen/teichoic acid export membrane protein